MKARLGVTRKLAIVGLLAVLAALLQSSLTFGQALTPEELAYQMGWDRGVVIVRYENQYGTGWWVAPGWLVTAAHVTDGRSGVEVIVYKGDWRATCQVVAVVGQSSGDVAVVRCPSMPRDAYIFRLLPITNETLAQLKGRPVYVLGYPYELVQLYGYDLARASANPRVAQGTFAWYDPQHELIEFNAITDAGNSGGPVVTEDGYVVGLVSYAITGEAGVMYLATSSNRIIEVLRMAGAPFQLAAVRPPDYVVHGAADEAGQPTRPLLYAAAAGLGLAVLLAVATRARR